MNFDRLAVEAEATDYDVEALKARRRGRPPMGSGPADVVPVRIDPELRAAIEAELKRTKPRPARSSAKQFAAFFTKLDRRLGGQRRSETRKEA